MPGTRSFHQFIPLNTTVIGAKRYSRQVDFTMTFDFSKQRRAKSYLNIGDYVACIYDHDWYIGIVEMVCEEEGDLQIKFLHPKGPGRPMNCFSWPPKEDICYIPNNDILKISAPTPSSKTARKYKISSIDAKSISDFMTTRLQPK